MMSLCFGSDRIPRKLILGIFGLGMLLDWRLCLKRLCDRGTEVIFYIGHYPAYDGVWFNTTDQIDHALMMILFAIRFMDPVLLLMLAGSCFSSG